MKQGGGDSGGFTIVETMIVLAVSGILAVSALLLVNGKQNKTEFQTAINNLQQQFQQIINETESGYYPNSGKIKCVGNSSPGGGPTLSAATTGQGTNNGCIFLGKVIQLGTDKYPGQLVIFSVAGNQYDSSGKIVQNIKTGDAVPTAIAPTDLSDPSDYPDSTTSLGLPSGLKVSTVAAQDGFWDRSNPPGWNAAVGQLAVLAGDPAGNIASYSTSGLNSGSQQFSLYIVKSTKPGPYLNIDHFDAAAQISAGNLQHVNSASLCVNSGTTAQSGLFTFGDAQSGGLGVSLQLYSRADC